MFQFSILPFFINISTDASLALGSVSTVSESFGFRMSSGLRTRQNLHNILEQTTYIALISSSGASVVHDDASDVDLLRVLGKSNPVDD
jgi:hypothetical protein